MSKPLSTFLSYKSFLILFLVLIILLLSYFLIFKAYKARKEFECFKNNTINYDTKSLNGISPAPDPFPNTRPLSEFSTACKGFYYLDKITGKNLMYFPFQNYLSTPANLALTIARAGRLKTLQETVEN